LNLLFLNNIKSMEFDDNNFLDDSDPEIRAKKQQIETQENIISNIEKRNENMLHMDKYAYFN